MTEDLWVFFNISLCNFFLLLALDFILPGHYESKLLVSRKTGDQWLQVLSKGQDNDNAKVPCATAQVLQKADFNQAPHAEGPWANPQPAAARTILKVVGPVHIFVSF